MTDNGSRCGSRRFRRLCRRLGPRRLRIRPHAPRTNGKAERFIQTALREWAYARSCGNSDLRAARLDAWLHHCNWRRPHASLDCHAPIQSLRLDLNNVVTIHS